MRTERSALDGRNRGPTMSRLAAYLFASSLMVAATPVLANTDYTDVPDQDEPETSEFPAGHGSVSIEYQHLFMNGDWWDVGPKKPFGSVIVNSLRLDADYFFADNWDVDLSLPFISAKYSGAYPHLLSTLEVPHPHTVFVEDGNWHGTWADWITGISYHYKIGSYYLTPTIKAYIPSHNYTFYGSATVGDGQKKLGIGVTLAHQFDFSNFYYSAQYEYVFVEKTLGINADFYRFGMDLGYFVNPRLSVRGFFEGKLGNGVGSTEIVNNCCSSEFWFLHDKFRREEHFNVGGGLDYQLNPKLTLSASAFRMVWGRDNLNLKYGLDLRITRSF